MYRLSMVALTKDFEKPDIEINGCEFFIRKYTVGSDKRKVLFSYSIELTENSVLINDNTESSIAVFDEYTGVILYSNSEKDLEELKTIVNTEMENIEKLNKLTRKAIIVMDSKVDIRLLQGIIAPCEREISISSVDYYGNTTDNFKRNSINLDTGATVYGTTLFNIKLDEQMIKDFMVQGSEVYNKNYLFSHNVEVLWNNEKNGIWIKNNKTPSFLTGVQVAKFIHQFCVESKPLRVQVI